MGKHCSQEFLTCIQNCVDNYGDSWRASACVLDCELSFATCVIRDFSSALQGKELLQAAQTASKIEAVAIAYQTAACSIRNKASIGFTQLSVKKSDGTKESFYPEAKTFPSIVSAGASLGIARRVTDKVITEFSDGMATADIKGIVISEFKALNSDKGENYNNFKGDSSCKCE